MWGSLDALKDSHPYFCTGFIAFQRTAASMGLLRRWKASLDRSPGLNQPAEAQQALDQATQGGSAGGGTAGEGGDGAQPEACGRVLVGVLTTWADLLDTDRITAIAQTWAADDARRLAEVRFFVGARGVKARGSTEEMKRLAVDTSRKLEGLIGVEAPRGEAVVVLPEATDSKYPPQEKNFLMWQWMAAHAAQEERDEFDGNRRGACGGRAGEFGWYMKADSDTYINVARLGEMLSRYSPQRAMYIGQQGFGRVEDRGKLGLVAPYCLGGTGYILSRAALVGMQTALPLCQHHTSTPHEDTEMGRCVQRYLQLGCCDGSAIDSQLSMRLFVNRCAG